jgi:outer membrane protein
VVDSETTLTQQEITLKNLLSRTGTTDPVLRAARIVPVDPIVIPAEDNLPPLDELVKQALAQRSDLVAEVQNEKAAAVSALGTRNGVLPSLGVFASESQAGLSGTGRVVVENGVTEIANPYLVGGIGNALAQVFRRDFPTEQAGFFVFGPLRNRQAQADFSIDQLQYRQTQLTTRKDLNQVQVDVLNYVVALRQARARYDAAVQNRILQEQLLDAEQKRFNLGASIPYNVVQQQRDLATAKSTEVSARVAYSTARIALDRTVGTLLPDYHVSLDEARNGAVMRVSVAPSAP